MFSLTVEEMVFERVGTAEMFKQVYNVRNHRDVMFYMPNVTFSDWIVYLNIWAGTL